MADDEIETVVMSEGTAGARAAGLHVLRNGTLEDYRSVLPNEPLGHHFQRNGLDVTTCRVEMHGSPHAPPITLTVLYHSSHGHRTEEEIAARVREIRRPADIHPNSRATCEIPTS